MASCIWSWSHLRNVRGGKVNSAPASSFPAPVSHWSKFAPCGTKSFALSGYATGSNGEAGDSRGLGGLALDSGAAVVPDMACVMEVSFGRA